MSVLTVSTRGIARKLDFKVIAAFFAIYIIWGSTFLAIRVAVLLAPPWFCAGVRFFTAGVVLFSFMRLRGAAWPTGKEWRSLAVIGLLMFSVTYGALFWAEQYVPSGITAVLEAMIPLITVLLEVFVLRQQRFKWMTAVAVLVGFLGVAVMMLRGGQEERAGYGIGACFVVLLAGLAWSLGAVLTRAKSGRWALTLPESKALTSGAEMMLGGSGLLVVSLLSGEMRPFPHVPLRAGLALVYLIVMGSLVGYTAFVYLLGKMPASRVASHAYVNPVVAIALGYFAGGEAITARTLVGAGLVIGSVVLTMVGARVGEAASLQE